MKERKKERKKKEEIENERKINLSKVSCCDFSSKSCILNMER